MNAIKNKIGIVIILFSFFILQIAAQNLQPLIVTVKFDGDTLGLLDPWHFIVELKNSSTRDVELLPTNIICGMASVSAEIKIEIKNDKVKSWVDSKAIINWCNADGYKPFNLRPNEIVSYEFDCPASSSLLDIGWNEIRISYANFCHFPNPIYSAPVPIRIKNYIGEDLAAYNYLIGLKNPNFILFPVINTSSDTSNIVNSEYIVKHFPNSFFADYGRLNLCFLYSAKANYSLINHESQDTVVSYLRNSKKFGTSVLGIRNSKISEKSQMLLLQLLGIVQRAYISDLPLEIEKEFTFTNKN